MLMSSCVFNELKYDRKCLLAVAILDGCAAIGWSIRTDRAGFCEKSADHTGPCQTALVAVALVFSWISAIVVVVCTLITWKRKRKHPRCRYTCLDEPSRIQS
ncbi:hypothetical protein EDB87DRAFT_150951 [Lactarius vividus]|nr:hypothetical protein EDB87DRAFT_150951 [Lactarius vividus]